MEGCDVFTYHILVRTDFSDIQKWYGSFGQ